MPTVLFVCSANMCRSPMAEALFICFVRQDESRFDWDAESAGVWAIDGSYASGGAVKAMQRLVESIFLATVPAVSHLR